MKLITSTIALLLTAFAAGPPDQFSRSSPTPCAAHDVFWGHVYNPTRLTVQAPCVRVTGVIADATAGKEKDGLRHEEDGDSHGWLRLDPGQDKYLNDGNRTQEGGNLVFEVVCLFPVKQPDAVAACTDHHSPLVVPPVGTHVAMVGTWVLDDNHEHWFEIHPVFQIETLK
jgi:hypothetical protein